MFSPYDSQRTPRTRSVFQTCYYLSLLVYQTVFLCISKGDSQGTLIHIAASVYLIFGYTIDVEIRVFSFQPTGLKALGHLVEVTLGMSVKI